MISALAVLKPGLGSVPLAPAPWSASKLFRAPLPAIEPAAMAPDAKLELELRMVVEAPGEVDKRSTFFLGKKPSLPIRSVYTIGRHV